MWKKISLPTKERISMDNYTMTKIVATLGPASCTKEKIKELFQAGVTMFRLNSSHGDVAMHEQNLN